jgi:hypothetical protein
MAIDNIGQNYDEVVDQEDYVSFIQYKVGIMKGLLPENTKFVKIMKCMTNAWRKHKEQDMDIQQAMYISKDEYLNSF